MTDTNKVGLPIAITNDEVPLFLGGLFRAVVDLRSREILALGAARGLPVDDPQQRKRYLEAACRDAFKSIASGFPEPLRSRLKENENAFVASVLDLR